MKNRENTTEIYKYNLMQSWSAWINVGPPLQGCIIVYVKNLNYQIMAMEQRKIGDLGKGPTSYLEVVLPRILIA